MKMLIMALLLCMGWGEAQWALGAEGGKRVALLIGNAGYSTARLSNPPQDVKVMEAALAAVGFKVQKVLDADQNQMKRAVRDFGTLAQGAEVAFLYYSGHGTQANGENYLIPVKATIEKESDYEVEAVSANALMRQIAGARPQAAIVVLDACRDNPYASMTKSVSKGLGRMDAPTGTMIAFATAPNTTASDEGHYARVLAAQLKTPGLELFDVFRNTTAEVRRVTKGKQEPRVSEVSITERIYLAGQGREPPPPPLPVQIASVEPEPVVPTPQPEPAAPAAAGTVFKDCADCPELVVIPAGRFLMGSPAAEQAQAVKDGAPQNKVDREKPQHEVRIGSAFALGKTEVTRGEFGRFVSATGHKTEGGCYVWSDKWEKKGDVDWKNPGFAQTDDHPVVCVSWNDAQAYVKWLREKTKKAYRLPSEAEWEYAARAGTTTAFSTGSTITPEQANFNGNSTFNGSAKGQYRAKTVAARSFAANGFGLYNLHGNVFEWVEDCYHENYEGATSDGSVWATNCKENWRVVRGGSWGSVPRVVRSAYRNSGSPAVRYSYFGFRVARTYAF